MKTIIKKTGIILLLTISYALHANNVDLISNTNNDLEIILNNVNNGDKWIIQGETFKQKGILKGVELGISKISLKTLKNGSYRLEINKEFLIENLYFDLLNGKIEISQNKSYVFYKPSIRLKNNQLFISNYSFNKDDVLLSLFYNNKLIYDENIQAQENPQRLIKLDNDIHGEYRIEIKVNGNTYTKRYWF